MNKFVALMPVWLGLALTTVSSVSARAEDLVLAVSEGTSGGLDAAQVIAKYKDLADAIGHGMKAKVHVVFVRDFATLEEGFKTSRYAFVMARPSDYPARGMRDSGYNYVASAKPDGQCYIVVKKDSPLKTLNDIKGKKIAMPEKVAYMSKFCAAELRTKGIDLDKENVQYVKEQAAVTFYLDNKFADAGAIASYSSVGKNWEKNGNRILHKSVTQPYFPLVAYSKVRPDQIQEVQKVLLSLPSTPAGQEILKRIGVNEFDTGAEAKMRELPKWLGQ
ncbi:MAG: PhnD/SsuA/transferrin family substrate-binding protein [Burkholderiaceae bacterium]|nr:PhnD/SsuA/transferrin family substrate-binding protein [Burkholderiaceae bacterium]